MIAVATGGRLDGVTVAGAAATTAAALDLAAPELGAAFAAALPRAGRTVTAKLLAALHRERLTTPEAASAATLEATSQDPLPHLAGLPGAVGPLAAELADAVANLALAYARRAAADTALRAGHPDAVDLVDLAATLPADEQILLFERLATEGHNLHPCGRTRLGWSPYDVLAHDLEGPGTAVGFVAVDRDLHLGDDVGALLRAAYPRLPADDRRHVVQPMHAWQLATVLPARYGDLLADGTLRILDTEPLPAAPTAALRTVLLPPGVDGSRRYLKLSLDIQVTSTRRNISVASTRNAVPLSGLVGRLLADEGVLVLAETAGSAVPAPGAGRDRDLAAIVRDGLTGRLRPGEVAVPGTALTAVSPLSGRAVVDELLARSGLTPPAFLAGYARLLLPPLLRLLARHGIAMEAHLQNSIVTFVGGRPARLVLRDMAGLRLHRPRLTAAGHDPRCWPGSVVVTDDLDVARAKLAYTALRAHLGELVAHFARHHGVDEPDAWAVVGEIVDDAYAGGSLSGGACGVAAAADRHWLRRPDLPHKALVRMRLDPGGGDRYVPVANPLADRPPRGAAR